MTRDEILALPRWDHAERPRLMITSLRPFDPNEPLYVIDDDGEAWEPAEQNGVLKRRLGRRR